MKPEIKKPAIIDKLKEKSLVSEVKNELDLINLYYRINKEEIKDISSAFKLPLEQRKKFFNEFMENFEKNFTPNLVAQIGEINIMKDYQKRDQLVVQYRTNLRGLLALAHKNIFGKSIERIKQKYTWEQSTVKRLAKNFEERLTELLPKKVKRRENKVDEEQPVDEATVVYLEGIRDKLIILQNNLKKDISLIDFFYRYFFFLVKNSQFALQEEVNALNRLKECLNFMRNQLVELDEKIAKKSSPKMIDSFLKKISSGDYECEIEDKLKEGSEAFRDGIEVIKTSICKRFNIYIKSDILKSSILENMNTVIKELLDYKAKKLFFLQIPFFQNSVKELLLKVSETEKTLEEKLDRSKQEYIGTVRDKYSTYEGWMIELGLTPELTKYKDAVESLKKVLFSEDFQNKIIETLNKHNVQDPEELEKILTIFYGPDVKNRLFKKLSEFYRKKSSSIKEEEDPGIQVGPSIKKEELPLIKEEKKERLFTGEEIEALEKVATFLSKSINMMNVLTQITDSNEGSVEKIRQQTEEIQTLLENIPQEFPQIRSSVESYCNQIIDETKTDFELRLKDIRELNEQNFSKVKAINTFNFDFDLKNPSTKVQEHAVNLLKEIDINWRFWGFKSQNEIDNDLKNKILEYIRTLKGFENDVKDKEVIFQSFDSFEVIYKDVIEPYMDKDEEAINRRKQNLFEYKEYEMDFERLKNIKLDDFIQEVRSETELQEYKDVSEELTIILESEPFKKMLYRYIIENSKITDVHELNDFFSLFYGKKSNEQVFQFFIKNQKYHQEHFVKSELEEKPKEKSVQKVSLLKEPLSATIKPLPKKIVQSEPIKKDPSLVRTAPKKPLPKLPKKPLPKLPEKKSPISKDALQKGKEGLKKLNKGIW